MTPKNMRGMQIIRRFRELFAIDGIFWRVKLMNKHLGQDNAQADLIHSALRYLPPNDGIDWYPICVRAIAQLDETLARSIEDYPAAVPLIEWRRTNPVSIASCAFEWMTIEYKFGLREKWLRRLDKVYFEELARFRENEKVRSSGLIDGAR